MNWNVINFGGMEWHQMAVQKLSSSCEVTWSCFAFQLHYNSKTLKTESPNTSRGSSLPRTLSKESKLYGMKDTATSPPLSSTVHSKTNTLLPPQPPPIPSGTYRQTFWTFHGYIFPWCNLLPLDLAAPYLERCIYPGLTLAAQTWIQKQECSS